MDVIQVDDDLPLIDELSEDLVHRPLEGGGRVAEAEEHDSGLKQAPVGPEGGLPFISFLDPHIVVPPPNVQLGEVPGILDPVDEFLDEGEGVAVLDSVLIELPIVLYWSQGSIPFENEKEWRRHWRVGVTNSARPKVFLDEAVKGLLFIRGEGVDLAVGGYKSLSNSMQ